VHFGADNCDNRRVDEFFDWLKMKHETTGRVYVLGMGDYQDFMSTTERRALAAAGFHETTGRTIDDIAKEITMKFADKFSFMKDRIIGMLEGNHHYKFMSGMTSTQMMCEHLKCKYLGISSFIKLTLDAAHRNQESIDIWAHHGMGGGKRPGASVNSVEDMLRVAEADIYLQGHDHKKWAVLTTRLGLTGQKDSLKLTDRKILLARTGSFQIGYMPGKANYVSSGGMSPTDLGTVKIELTLKRQTQDGMQRRYVDIHASI
jgi:hypothetical protein